MRRFLILTILGIVAFSLVECEPSEEIPAEARSIEKTLEYPMNVLNRVKRLFFNPFHHHFDQGYHGHFGYDDLGRHHHLGHYHDHDHHYDHGHGHGSHYGGGHRHGHYHGHGHGHHHQHHHH